MDVHCKIISTLLYENFHNLMLGGKYRAHNINVAAGSVRDTAAVMLPNRREWFKRNGPQGIQFFVGSRCL